MVRGVRRDYLSYSASPTKAHGGVPICEVDSKARAYLDDREEDIDSISLGHA